MTIETSQQESSSTMQTNLRETPHGGRTNVTDPNFAWRILDQMPAAVVVVNSEAQVVYANAALIRLLGRDIDDDASVNILDYVHPDDAGWLAEAFLDVIDEGETQPVVAVLPSIHIRIVDGAGATIPLEITGARSIRDDVLGGVIYDVRPAPYHDILGHVLAGLGSGADVSDLLSLVAQLIALPPIDLEAAVMRKTPKGWAVVSATSPALAEAFADEPSLPFEEPSNVPVRIDPADLEPAVAVAVGGLGFVDIWRVSAGNDQYEIVAFARRRQRRSTSITERLTTAHELASVATKQAESESRLRHAARYDSLTDVCNRATFRDQLGIALENVSDRPVCVLFLDLDNFKPVNDKFGHGAGDYVLQVVAQRLRAAVRPDDVVARLGGDEFALLLTSPDSVAASHAIAERIVDLIASPVVIKTDSDSASVTVSASVGSVRAAVGDDVDRVLSRADKLMYEAKRTSGGTVRSDVSDTVD